MENLTFRFDHLGDVLKAAGATRQYGSQLVDLGGLSGAGAEYDAGGLVARIVDMPADMSVDRGLTVEGGSPELASELERLGVMERMGDAFRWSILDGGGALLLLARDGGTLDTPLDTARLDEVEEVVALSVDELVAGEEKYSDPEKPNYGMPVFYKRGAVKIHESRIIEVPGARARRGQSAQVAGIPWKGRPLSRRLLESIRRYRKTLDLSEKLVNRSQQAVHSMKGLAEQLLAGPEGEQVVRRRIDLVDANRGALNGVAVDSEDSYTITNASLSGVPDVLAAMREDIAANAGWPMSILFGRAPGGLNASGDSDWATFFSQCSQIQRTRGTPAMERMIAILLAQKKAKGWKVSEDWSVSWNPLEQVSEKDEAEVDNKRADSMVKVTTALAAAMDSGALGQEEAHEFLQEQRLFGLQPADAGGTRDAGSYANKT